MEVTNLHLGPLRTNCYLVSGSYQGKEYLIVIDPAEGALKIQKKILELCASKDYSEKGTSQENSPQTSSPSEESLRKGSSLENPSPESLQPLPSCNVTHIVLTHAHFDHIGAVKELLDLYPDALFCVGEKENLNHDYIIETVRKALGSYYFNKLSFASKDYALPKPDILLHNEDELSGFKIIHTPGHINGSICLYNEREGVIFTGDTLFKMGYGRTDLGGSEYDLVQSLRRILTLPDSTVVYPGHGESTTIGEERKYFG